MNAKNTKGRNMKDDVSNKVLGIVVPIYNTAAYLRECLDSIRFQTHENLCVLMVDDGSNDGKSLDIAREYVGLDSRFMLLCKENDGLSAARNTGLAWFKGEIDLEYEGEEKTGGGGGASASSPQKTHAYKPTNSNSHRTKSFFTQVKSAKPPKIDYILFFDSDDYLLPSFAQACLSHSNGMDIVWCDHFFDFEIEPPYPLHTTSQA